MPLLAPTVDDRGAVKVKAHQRLQGQFFGAKAITQAPERKMHVVKNRSIAGPRGELLSMVYSIHFQAAPGLEIDPPRAGRALSVIRNRLDD